MSRPKTGTGLRQWSESNTLRKKNSNFNGCVSLVFSNDTFEGSQLIRIPLWPIILFSPIEQIIQILQLKN